MSGGIEGLGFTPNTAPQAAQAQSPQSVTVKAQGQNVTYQPSISSLVEDAQEEVTELLGEKGAEKLKHRDAHTKSSSRLREILRKYMESVQGSNQTETFQKVLDALKNMKKPTPDEIRQKLKELSQGSGEDGFESGMLMALEEVLSAEGGNDDLLAAVREAKANLGAELRDFYQEQVKTYSDVGDVYKQLLGEYGEEDFLTATESMITQLGSDLQAQGASADEAKIKATADSLYYLEVARNTYAAFADLVEKMQSEFGVVFPKS